MPESHWSMGFEQSVGQPLVDCAKPKTSTSKLFVVFLPSSAFPVVVLLCTSVVGVFQTPPGPDFDYFTNFDEKILNC